MTARAPAVLVSWFREAGALAGAVAAIAALTAAYKAALGVSNSTVVALSYLLVVLLAAAASTLRVAVAASVLSVIALNYFFLPPVGRWTIEDPENWVALFVFLVVSVVASRLPVIARERARVRQRAELKSALLASLGHDLRTPLTALAAASENLRQSWGDEGQRREQLDIISTEVTRLSRLFQNIVEMARIETGGIDAEREWVHPADIVEAAVTLVQQSLREHALDLDVETERAVQIDPKLTSAALAHVLENAGRYAPAGTAITVTARVDDDGLTMSVRDRGPGIAPQDVPHLFDRFYRGADARRQAFGTGMGLAIARGLLAAQGGRVWAENAPDGGARFTLAVPTDSRRLRSDAGEPA